jgi:L-ascorbate metabolism protein UlaG (beta-lactamase superfamily)
MVRTGERRFYKSGRSLSREIRTKVSGAGIAFWFLGQSGIVVGSLEEPAEFLCIDPYLTKSIEEADPSTEFRRDFPSPLQPELLAGAAALLATHFHNDHLDLATIRRLAAASRGTRFVVPAPSASLLADERIEPHQIVKARDGDIFDLGRFRIEPIAVPHTAYERDGNGDTVFLGYAVVADGVRVFHGGDVVPEPELIERVKSFAPHVVFLPINGQDSFRTARGIVGNMNYREAADFAHAVQSDLVVPLHYDLFPNNSENPAYFVDYIMSTYPARKFHFMAVGERFVYPS